MPLNWWQKVIIEQENMLNRQAVDRCRVSGIAICAAIVGLLVLLIIWLFAKH